MIRTAMMIMIEFNGFFNSLNRMAQGIEEAPERGVKRHSGRKFNIKKGDVRRQCH